jgi:transcriptional regulator with XRE-family HTH domain
MAQQSLADFIRSRGTQLGVSQATLAARAGISRQALVKILSGDVRDPRLSTVIALARAVNVSPFALLRLWIASGTSRHALRSDDIAGDRSSFVDESLPSGALVGPGASITKDWTLQNTGDSVWQGRHLKCLNLPRDDGIPALVPTHPFIAIADTAIAQTVTLSMEFRCPEVPGPYLSCWKMCNSNGTMCFPELAPLTCAVFVIGF